MTVARSRTHKGGPPLRVVSDPDDLGERDDLDRRHGRDHRHGGDPHHGGDHRRGRPARAPRPRPSALPPRPSFPSLRTRPPARRPPARSALHLGDPRRRLRAAVVLFAVLLLVLAGRLVQLQGVQSTAYAKSAELQRLRVVALPAARGEVTDRHGAVLARDVDARDVYADPTLVADPARVAAQLAPLLRRPASALRPLLSGRGRFVYLARGADLKVGREVSRRALPGVGVLPVSRRDYPSKGVAAGVVGFTSRDDKDRIAGRGGVELAYDALLRGRDGSLRIEEDPAGRPIPSGLRREAIPISGSDVQLTLDRDIQWMAQTAITAAVRTTKARGGTIIVMDPRTGDLLAMANAPTFDPNAVGRANPATLGNPATTNVYEPGSVNKVITMAAALDAGLVTPDTPIIVPPTLPAGGFRIHDAEGHGVEHLTVAGVLAKSSNIGTVLVSRKLGPQKLEEALRRFGLGRPSGLDFPGESIGLLPPSSTWSDSQAATIPFGQGMSATALQMASVYATVANGGVHVPPRLVRATVEPSGGARPSPPGRATRVIGPQTATSVTNILEAVTTRRGTAPAAAIPGYRVAGKTGTAYRIDPTCGCYRGYVPSFVDFAPADDLRVVVEVVLDDPQAGHFGGQVAAPVFRQVMSFALQTLRVPPTGTRPPPLNLETG